MTDREAVGCARACLEAVTPLEGDCGRLCGSVCCRSMEGEETGMLLFPGEEPAEGMRTVKTDLGVLAVCDGTCVREERPLGCRLFPLLPLVRSGAIRVGVDERARGVCPLADQGVRALSEAFRQGVREAGSALMLSEGTRLQLERLTREQDSLKELRRQFGA